jgi:TonB family protein
MEAFALYFFKSAIWLTGFALVYFLFLQNERYFLLKRIYLITGILISFILPLFSVHYLIELPASVLDTAGVLPADRAAAGGLQQGGAWEGFNYRHFLFLMYISGIVFFVFKLALHVRYILKTINRAGRDRVENARVVRNSGFKDSFSFFNYVFVSPSLNETELEMIMNHELVHVNQRHWFDLLLVEVLRLFQWINPFAWIYSRFIRENHEYIADEMALQRIPDPAVYKAVLVNQLFNSRVLSLSNSFNYSISRKRFEMMKNIVPSPYRKMKVLMILPVFAIVLYAFATPVYKYAEPSVQPLNTAFAPDQNQKEASGVVVKEDGKPLPGAGVIVSASSIRVVTDSNGRFSVSRIPNGSSLIFSCKGYKTYIMPPLMASNRNLYVKLVKDPDYKEEISIRTSDGSAVKALVVVDGVINGEGVGKVNPDAILSMVVLKDEAAIGKYGEKGKDGVIEITTKKRVTQPDTINPDTAAVRPAQPDQVRKVESSVPEEPFVVVEQMPMFPGGEKELLDFIGSNSSYPEELKDKKISGKVIVRFAVNTDGNVEQLSILKGVHPVLDREALRVIGDLPRFIPGRQGGKAVPVWYMVPVNFVAPESN